MHFFRSYGQTDQMDPILSNCRRYRAVMFGDHCNTESKQILGFPSSSILNDFGSPILKNWAAMSLELNGWPWRVPLAAIAITRTPCPDLLGRSIIELICLQGRKWLQNRIRAHCRRGFALADSGPLNLSFCPACGAGWSRVRVRIRSIDWQRDEDLWYEVAGKVFAK